MRKMKVLPKTEFPENMQKSAQSRNSFLENVRASAQKTQQSTEAFEAGTRISHPMFGEGEILSAQPMGGDVLYEIEFANGSTKRLMGNFAKLKRI